MTFRISRPCVHSFLIAATWTATATLAQAETKTDGLWRGSGGAALSQTSGNSEATSRAISLNGSNATLRDQTTVGGAYNYGRSKSAGLRG